MDSSCGSKRCLTGTVFDTPVLVRNQPCDLNGWYFFNSGADPAYVAFFDKNSSDGVVDESGVFVGTPVFVIALPAGAAANAVSCGSVLDFLNGIVIAASLTRDGSGGNPDNPVDFNVLYS